MGDLVSTCSGCSSTSLSSTAAVWCCPVVHLRFANSLLLYLVAQIVTQPLALEFLQVLLLPEFFFDFVLLAQAFRFPFPAPPADGGILALRNDGALDNSPTPGELVAVDATGAPPGASAHVDVPQSHQGLLGSVVELCGSIAVLNGSLVTAQPEVSVPDGRRRPVAYSSYGDWAQGSCHRSNRNTAVSAMTQGSEIGRIHPMSWSCPIFLSSLQADPVVGCPDQLPLTLHSRT